MTSRVRRLLFALGIALAAWLRFTDLAFPDMATDEAQFALGWSAAHPPLGMWVLRLAQFLGGPEIWAARAAAAVAGTLTVIVLFFLARAEGRRDAAILTLFLAAVWPSHVLFSRLAFLTAFQCLAWITLTFCVVRARQDRSPPWIVAAYVATLGAVFIKAQGFLLPGLMLAGLLVERRQRILRDPLAWAIALGVLPAVLYVATHPGIPATVLLYAGNKFDAGNTLERGMILLTTWRMTMGVAALFIAYGLWHLRRLSWPVAMMTFLAMVQGLFLDPGSEYYSAQLVIVTLPVAVGLLSMGPPVRLAAWGLVAMVTLSLYGPRALFLSRWTYPLYREPGYWNTHAESINALLEGEEEVGVEGFAGHHLRWYLTPRVLVGEHAEGVTIYLQRKPVGTGAVLYDDGEVMVVRR